jgi:thiol-disulfide isomerase/thioredoxin
MKTILVSIFILFITILSSHAGEVEINGECVENISLFYLLKKGDRKQIKINLCKFSFKTAIEKKFDEFTLIVKENATGKLTYLGYLISQKSKLNIKIWSTDSLDYGKGIATTGLPFQKLQERYYKEIFFYQAKLNYTYTYNRKKLNDSLFNETQRAEVKTLLQDNKIEQVLRVMKFILKNNSSFFSMYIFNKDVLQLPTYSSFLKTSELSNTLNKFPKAIQQTELGIEVKKKILLTTNSDIGRKVPDFRFYDEKKELHRIYDILKQEKVLLYFTASWCGPCIRQLPVLKTLANDPGIHNFKIIIISVDHSKEEWMKSLAKNEYPGLMTWDNPEYIMGNDLSNFFSINLIPQSLLIDTNRTIIYNNIELKDSYNLEILEKMLRN